MRDAPSGSTGDVGTVQLFGGGAPVLEVVQDSQPAVRADLVDVDGHDGEPPAGVRDHEVGRRRAGEFAADGDGAAVHDQVQDLDVDVGHGLEQALDVRPGVGLGPE